MFVVVVGQSSSDGWRRRVHFDRRNLVELFDHIRQLAIGCRLDNVFLDSLLLL